MPCHVVIWGSIRASQEAENVRGKCGQEFLWFLWEGMSKAVSFLWEGMSRLGLAILNNFSGF